MDFLRQVGWVVVVLLDCAKKAGKKRVQWKGSPFFWSLFRLVCFRACVCLYVRERVSACVFVRA